MKITINNKELELKYSIRSLMMYENMTNKNFNPTTITEIITFMYCIVLASSKDYSITFDDFIEWVDENPEALNLFNTWLSGMVETNNSLKKK